MTLISACTNSSNDTINTVNGQNLSNAHKNLMSHVLFVETNCELPNPTEARLSGNLTCKSIKRKLTSYPKKQKTPYGYWFYSSEKKDLFLKEGYKLFSPRIDFLTGKVMPNHPLNIMELNDEKVILTGILEINKSLKGNHFAPNENNLKREVLNLSLSKKNSKNLQWETKTKSGTNKTQAFYDPSTDILYGETSFVGGKYQWRASRLSKRIFQSISAPTLKDPYLLGYVIKQVK